MPDQHVTGLPKIRTEFIDGNSSNKLKEAFIRTRLRGRNLVCVVDGCTEFVDRIGSDRAISVEMIRTTAYIAQLVASIINLVLKTDTRFGSTRTAGFEGSNDMITFSQRDLIFDKWRNRLDG